MIDENTGVDGSVRTTAIVTASYSADFERCRVLCETIDRHVTGHTRHLILVSDRDTALFRKLQAGNRIIVSESEILPAWLHDFPDPLSLFKRRIWLSLRTKPMRGWHVQQLRRIAIASHVDEQTLLYCDSDVAFLKPFDCASLHHGNDVRLFRRDFRLRETGHSQQIIWANNAAEVLNLPADQHAEHDYIATLIAWDTGTVRALCDHIEAQAGKHWLAAIGSARKFSECMIYGRYVDDVCAGRGHFHDNTELCHIYWYGPELDNQGIKRFIESLGPQQVAIGLQSFIGTDIAKIRQLVLLT